MSSKFPEQFDLFETKHNAQTQDDPTGDYVMAEHINDLQDAIEAIQRTLGIRPQSSYQNIGDRISKTEVTSALRASNFLYYMGKPGYINQSKSLDEAVGHYLQYDHIVFGASAEDETNPNNQDVKSIIKAVKKIKNTSFYGYIDCGLAAQSLAEIQNKINKWRNVGVDGIYCDRIDYSPAIDRDRQNLILDSIHQYNLKVILYAENPDQILTDLGHEQYNPSWKLPNLEKGDAFHFTHFGVNTLSTGYRNVSTMQQELEKLLAARKATGVQLFCTATISDKNLRGQEYNDYAHALAVLYSMEAYGLVDPNAGALNNEVYSYDWTPIIGSWYVSDPDVVTEDNKVYRRKTGFGEIEVDMVQNRFAYKGISIPSFLLRMIDNSMDGKFIQDATLDEKKIKAYNPDRITKAINESEYQIDMDNIKGLLGNGGGLSKDVLQVNILDALNANIALLNADVAAIGSLTAQEIRTGKLSADRISASVVAAINLYAATIEAGDAKINNAAIGELSVDNMKAKVIEAVNISTTNITAEKLKATVVEAVNLSATDIAAERMRANVVSAVNGYFDTMTVGSAKINAAVIGELVASNIKANFIVSDMIASKAIKADKIDVDAVTTETIKAGSITSSKISTTGLDASVIKTGYLDTDLLEARSIDATKIVARSITALEIAANTINANNIQADAITADKIKSGSISTEHISTVGLDAQLISIYNGKTGETLIGSGFLRVDGLDVGVVQSDNLIMNGLFLTASSAYGMMRDNQAGEVIIGSMASSPGSHQVWKIDTGTGEVLNRLDVPGKKPYGIALDANEEYAYVSVQGNNTIVQVDLENYVATPNTLPSETGPAKVYYSGKKLQDHKHMLVLATDADDMNIPDSLMVVDGPPNSINTSLYLHHVIPLGNNPYDVIVDSYHRAYVTMASEGHIVVLDLHDRNSTEWKITGRIPISAYGTDNYHGGLPSQYGLNEVVGGSAAITYQKEDMMGAGHAAHNHGGYGSMDGSMKEYEPHGLAQSSDPDTLYVVDFKNNELVVVDKNGSAPYNPLSGTREQGNLGVLGNPIGAPTAPTDPGTGHDHYMSSMEPMMDDHSGYEYPPTTGPTPESTSGVRDYSNTNGETKYVRYRIPIGNAPDFVEVSNGKIYITLSGAGKIAIIDEQAVVDRIAIDREYYANYNEFGIFNEPVNFEVRQIEVGSRPEQMLVDERNAKLYVTLNGQNQIAVVDMMTEVVEKYINVGANPKGIALTEDGSTIYVVNHGGAGNLSFVYKEGPYIGDAYLGLEGEISHHGAQGWMPDRSDWTHDVNGDVKSNATVEFRINEPFLNEGGYVKISALGEEHQWAQIEQDIVNVTNYSDGTNPEGTWFKHHNGSALISLSEGNSPNFSTTFEIDEFVPKYIVYDNQQTKKFRPIEHGVDEEYEGLVYSGLMNRAASRIPVASADPLSGTLDIVTNGVHEAAEFIELPAGVQSMTIDLGKIYMVPKIKVTHKYHSMRTYKDTKTEVSEDGITWHSIWDSSVDGTYPEMRMTDTDHGHGDHMMMEHGKEFLFDARPVRYVRDSAGGWTEPPMTEGGMTMSGDKPTWAEIEVFGDWEVEYGKVYPNNSEKAGHSLASNGKCFVSTDVQQAYIAMDINIEFSCWSWITFIAGPEYGTMAVEMPTLMAADHFVDQSWPYITNLSHKHTMIFPPSKNIKANPIKNIKEGKHRLILKQSRGRVTLDRSRFDDYQFYTKSSTLITNSANSTFRRHKIICEQTKGYQGVGRQSSEGAYDEQRISPDTGLPDKSIAIKYRFRVRCELNPIGGVEERGIAYVTSCIMETGKLSSHWRMSQSSDFFPGTRIEAWDGSQPHKTGIQNFHLANGAVRGNKIMSHTIMDHHVSPYARISEFKLDLKYATHPHGKYVPDPMHSSGKRFISNKHILDEITGFGPSGDSTLIARADHIHTDMLQVGGTPDQDMIPIYLNGSVIWAKQTHSVEDISDLEEKYYDKAAVDMLIQTTGGGSGDGTGGGGDVYRGQENVLSKTNIFVNAGTAIRIQPISEVASTTVMFEVLNRAGARQFGIEYGGRISASKVVLSAPGTEANDAVRADRQVKAGTGLEGGGALTGDVTLSVRFAGEGTANTAARSDHTHTGYVSTTVSNQVVQNNFTINGAMWIGNSTASGSLVLRKDGVNSIQIDATNQGKLGTADTYIGIGTAQYKGNVRVGSLTVDTRDVVANLNAELLNGVAERDLVKTATIRDIGGQGVYRGLEVQARPVPDMSVVIKPGLVYTSSGKRISISEMNISLQISSVNFDRIDTIYIQGESTGTNEGRPAVLTGVPSATPVKGTLPAGSVELATILVRSNIGSITDGYNRGAGTVDGSFRAITDTRQWRPVIWDNNQFSVIGQISSSSDISEKGSKLEEKYSQLTLTNRFKAPQIIEDGTSTLTLSASGVKTTGEYVINDQLKVRADGALVASKNATKLTIAKGTRSVVWTHNFGNTNYVTSFTPNTTARHVSYKNLSANSIQIFIDQPYNQDIDILCLLIGY